MESSKAILSRYTSCAHCCLRETRRSVACAKVISTRSHRLSFIDCEGEVLRVRYSFPK